MAEELIAKLGEEQLTPQEQKERCESFLRENPGSPAVVQYLKTVTRSLELEKTIAERSLEAVVRDNLARGKITMVEFHCLDEWIPLDGLQNRCVLHCDRWTMTAPPVHAWVRFLLHAMTTKSIPSMFENWTIRSNVFVYLKSYSTRK